MKIELEVTWEEFHVQLGSLKEGTDFQLAYPVALLSRAWDVLLGGL